ncbi:hypothetical protein L486_06369 [Kwoniella mangroviensis CBS 10435]|uniref:Uncharacterized protein n=1 Tax=Kwoniella mangroviensis CBS 10435 TaxID=1331196 RepID=A0A1B9ILI5_9TREE|nr:hypothetical protein L486_06369 [Kwoniella mangroviensis CBS 10435]
MPTFTPPSDPAPNKLTEIHNMVWSIPNIRSEIMLYLPDKDVITLLRTIKIHFQAAVERLYRVFPYEGYHKLLKRCTDKARKQCYWSAVHTVELHRTTSPSEWTRYFVPFPNATCLQNFDTRYSSDPFILHRTFEDGRRQYTIVPPGDHSLWDVRKALRTSKPPIDIPKSRQSRRPLNIMINCEDPELKVEEQAKLETSLRDLSNKPQLLINQPKLSLQLSRLNVS